VCVCVEERPGSKVRYLIEEVALYIYIYIYMYIYIYLYVLYI